MSADLGFCLIINYNIKLTENLNQLNQMKIDELPTILITDIFRHLEPGILLNLYTVNKRFYEAVAATQLHENFWYFTEGYKATERLYWLFNSDENRRNKFIFGVLYLAFSRTLNHKFHHHPQYGE